MTVVEERRGGFSQATEDANVRPSQVPDLRSETYETFCGVAPTLRDFEARYDVDECLYVGDLAGWLAGELEDGGRLHLLHGLNSDSGNYAKPARGVQGRDESPAWM